MDKPKRKLAGGILMLAVLGIVYFVFLLKTNAVVNGAYNLDSYIAAAAGFLLLSVLIGYMLFGYRKGFAYWSKAGEDLDEQQEARRKHDEDSERKADPRKRWALNLISYAGMIFFVYMSLYHMGINIGALIASLSLPAFALSLGAKDLITDIIAGISIVFDREFKVGDIVEIEDYTGTVLEIGVRTTKLQGDSDHIKIIANRDIKNVLNKSREISTYDLKVKLSLENYRLRDVEEILEKELPKLQGRIPGLINGPFYRGVSRIRRKSVTLCFEADFEEEDHDEVKRALNHALLDIFDEYGIRRRKTN